MESDKFISVFTKNKCSSFKDFISAAKEFNIYFEKIDHDILLCYNGKGDANKACLGFYKFLFPNSDFDSKSFNIITQINESHKKFIINEINNVYKKYGFPPRYDQSISFKDNITRLLNILKFKTAVYKEDADFIKYVLNF